jgi:23S rRNA G2445 N2-methylase RlmL
MKSARDYTCEAEASEGLEDIASDELRSLSTQRSRVSQLQTLTGAVRFQFSGDLRQLIELQTLQAVYLLQQYPVPRPKALLGDEHFRRLVNQIQTVLTLFPGATFRTFYLNAAGSDSSVMQRLKAALAQATQLRQGDQQGDLLVRLRPSSSGQGWDALVRLTPRPLATRHWRVCNFEGALNGAVAQAMIRLSRPTADDAFVNLCCGSGSLLIERALWGGAARLIGIDSDPDVLQCAVSNITASGAAERLRLLRADARSLPLPDSSVDVLCADLPFGQRTGSHRENLRLYPALLDEGARVTHNNSRFLILTHEVRLIENLLHTSKTWEIEQTRRISLRGLHPRIYLLRMRH